MGCNNSKLDPQGEAVPAKIRPLLRRRIEEIRRRRNAITFKVGNLSKKKLLKDGAEEDDQSDHSSPPSVQDNNESKSISSLEGSIGSSKVAPEPVSDISSKEFAEVTNQEKSTKEDNKDNDEEKREKVAEPVVILEEVMVVELEEGEDEDEDEDERRVSNVEDSLICPGSPSFRVYCIQSLTDDKDDSHGNDLHKKSPSDDSVEISESINSSEGSVTKIKKKSKKGSKFMRVIPKGRPGAVKHLLNVKSCYYPACSGHDETRLLSTKVHA